MGIVDTILAWLKFIIFAAIVIWVAWWGITHASEVASFIVTIINGIKAFFSTLIAGIF